MNKLEYIVVSKDDRDYISQCLKLINHYQDKNPNNFKHMDIIEISKYIVCAVKDNKVYGFVALLENVLEDKDLFISQMAVDNTYIFESIGPNLIEFVKSHSRGYKKITTSAYKHQTKSIRFFEKMGFEKSEGYFDDFKFELNAENISDSEILTYTDDSIYLT